MQLTRADILYWVSLLESCARGHHPKKLVELRLYSFYVYLTI
jgi:hypothetical protein